MTTTILGNPATPRADFPVSADAPVLCLRNTQDRPRQTAYEFHYPLEIGIVLEGKMRRVFSDWEAVLGPGQAWFCGMWEPHGYQVVVRPCRRVVMMIHPPMLAETRFQEAPGYHWLGPFLVPPRDRPQIAAPPRREEVRGLARRIEANLLEGESVRGLRARLLAWETILTLTRDWRPPPRRTAARPGAFERVNRAIEAVLASPRRVSAQEAARMCGLGRNRFGSLFRDVTGVAFPLFALRFRLSGAASQLACTDDPIKAVARSWDFADDSHFHRAFQRHYGLSPTDYRSQGRSFPRGQPLRADSASARRQNRACFGTISG
jgi:AraC-like DNA-binding protein